MVTPNQPVPLPSHIHYELLLQLLEQQTMAMVYPSPHLKQQTQELIFTLRKALSQQRQLEQTCKLSNVTVEYQWSTNQPVERFSAEVGNG